MRLMFLAGIAATAITLAVSTGASAAPVNATVIDTLAAELNVTEPAAYCRRWWRRWCRGGYCHTRWWRRCWY